MKPLYSRSELPHGIILSFWQAAKMQKVFLIDEAVMLPVIYEYSYFIQSKGVSGIYFYPTGDIMYFINAVKK